MVVVDLCCGSGAVGAAVAGRGAGGRGARRGRRPGGDGVRGDGTSPTGAGLTTGDLYAALPDDLRGRVDVLVANAPYVPTDAIAHHAARGPRPRAAGRARRRRRRARRAAPDHRRGARDWLAPGGHLLIETGRSQAAGTVAACEAAGLDARVVTDDDLDATAVVATPSVGLSR